MSLTPLNRSVRYQIVSASEYQQAILGAWSPRKVREHCRRAEIDVAVFLDEEFAKMAERNRKLVFAAMDHHEELVRRVRG